MILLSVFGMLAWCWPRRDLWRHAHLVALRTGEIGVRMTLARPGHVPAGPA